MTAAQLSWTLQDMLIATNGQLHGDSAFMKPITGISIDSRECQSGDLFVSLPGTQTDGHKFLAKAMAAGAHAALVTEIDTGLKILQIQVANTLNALHQLAASGRSRFVGVQFGITGSVGKTGSKDMLHYLLSQFGNCHASKRSFNNNIGVPTSIASLPENADFSVQEIGMNAEGEISKLSRLVRPHVAFITRITDAHSAFFSSTKHIAQAKAEIFQNIEGLCTAVLNHDDQFFELLKTAAFDAGVSRILTFGRHKHSDFCLLSLDQDDDGMQITARLQETQCHFKMNMHGGHLAENAMGVLACIAAAGLPVDVAATYFVGCKTTIGRGQRIHGIYQNQKITVIDDSYNASPASMTAAFCSLASAPPQIMVLSEMCELGNATKSAHFALALQINNLFPRVVIAIGSAMQSTVNALDNSIHTVFVKDPEAAIIPLMKSINDGDKILIKGSNGSGAWQVRDALYAGMTRTKFKVTREGAL